VNAALAALLRGHNTTISIAHRLSTIKRSDTIIVLSTDGRVAEQGSYAQLAANPDGAFSRLMEWQMSGGDSDKTPEVGTKRHDVLQAVESEEGKDKAGRI
jgi:putative ABC transport system ATP-binding protein